MKLDRLGRKKKRKMNSSMVYTLAVQNPNVDGMKTVEVGVGCRRRAILLSYARPGDKETVNSN